MFSCVDKGSRKALKSYLEKNTLYKKDAAKAMKLAKIAAYFLSLILNVHYMANEFYNMYLMVKR